MSDPGQDAIPIRATISGSAKQCHVSNEPPFEVTITFENIVGATIWVLRPRFTYMCEGVEIRDPERRHRRIGPTPTSILLGDEPDPNDTETDDTEILRLGNCDVVTRKYTFTAEKKLGFLHSDFHSLKVGHTYQLTIRNQKWWWMFEKDMPPDLSVEEKRTLLSRQDSTKWKPECLDTFKLVD